MGNAQTSPEKLRRTNEGQSPTAPIPVTRYTNNVNDADNHRYSREEVEDEANLSHEYLESAQETKVMEDTGSASGARQFLVDRFSIRNS